MLVAIGLGGVDAAGLYRDVDARVVRVRLVELDRAGELVEAAAHFAEQVANLEGDIRVAAVDLEWADGAVAVWAVMLSPSADLKVGTTSYRVSDALRYVF